MVVALSADVVFRPRYAGVRGLSVVEAVCTTVVLEFVTKPLEPVMVVVETVVTELTNAGLVGVDMIDTGVCD